MKNLFVLLLSMNFMFLTPLQTNTTTEANINDYSWAWNTFMGSWHAEHGKGIAVDTDGNVYVTGLSKATWGSPVISNIFRAM